MLITQDTPQGKYKIQSYQPGRITINDIVYFQSLIVMPTTLITAWPPRCVADLTSAHLLILQEQHLEVVLLGTGATGQFLPAALLAPLFNQHIGVEVMSTAAACRTFTALAAEGRSVAAALLIE